MFCVSAFLEKGGATRSVCKFIDRQLIFAVFLYFRNYISWLKVDEMCSLSGATSWLKKNTVVVIAIAVFLVAFVSIIVLIHYSYPDTLISVPVALFGMIFVALKYQLDKASYHKSLFEERYAIFLKIDEIISLYDRDKEENEIGREYFTKELDSIYRKGYFLFGDETYTFLGDFRQQVINKIHYRGIPRLQLKEEQKQALDKADKFLRELRDKQKLSEKFPELKIDFY